RDAIRRAEKIARATDGVDHTVAISGHSLLLNANSSNFGSMYVMLSDFHARTGLGADAIAAELQQRLLAQIEDATVHVFGAPPVSGLSTAGGFKIMIEDRTSLGPHILEDVANNVVEKGNSSRRIKGLYTSYRADTPWLQLDIDRTEVKMMGASTGD